MDKIHPRATTLGSRVNVTQRHLVELQLTDKSAIVHRLASLTRARAQFVCAFVAFR